MKAIPNQINGDEPPHSVAGRTASFSTSCREFVIEEWFLGRRYIHILMQLVNWWRRVMQTSGWTREQAALWAARHFPEQRDTAAMVGEILIAQTGVGFEALTPGTRFIEDLAMDDLEPTQVVLAIEEEFKFAMPDEDCARLRTVADLVSFVHQRRHANAGTP